MKTYGVGEFRKGMKTALDEVSAGEEIAIVRGSSVFLIMKAKMVVGNTPRKELNGTPVRKQAVEKSEAPVTRGQVQTVPSKCKVCGSYACLGH